MVLLPTTFVYFSPEFRPFTPVALASYKKGQSHIVIRTRIDYRDVFGRKHWVETCHYHAFGTGLEAFSACKTGNRTDTQ